MSAYYNENDPFAVAWLRELIKAGLIADGEVDERSIADVTADDVRGFTQCHFFAGIGEWSYALRLAGWSDSRGVWTGSCPCQPFSSAGKGLSADDPRHLWPAWFRLIGKCKPDEILGEQVASPDGRAWFDIVCDNLETDSYAVAPVVIPACGIGAPFAGPRIYFVAKAAGERASAKRLSIRPRQSHETTTQHARPHFWSTWDWYRCTDGRSRPIESGSSPMADGVSSIVGRVRGYGNAIVPEQARVFIEAYMSLDVERAVARGC